MNYFIICLIAIMIQSAAVDCKENQTEIDTLLNTGIDLCIEGKQQKGIEYFNDLLRISPNNYLAYLNRGIAYFTLFEDDKALADFIKCTKLEPYNPQAFFQLGYLKSSQGILEEAKDYYTKSIEVDPNYLRAYGAVAIIKAMLGQVDDAIKDMNKAISIDPEYPLLYIIRAQISELKCNCLEAINNYRKAMVFNPEAFNSNLEIAWILATCPDEKYRNLDMAQTLLMKAKDRKDDKVKKVMAAIHAGLGDFQKAIIYQKKFIETSKQRVLKRKIDKINLKNDLKDYLDQLKSYENHKPWYSKPIT